MVSKVYFIIGILSLCTGLLVPFLARYVPRRWVYVTGASCFVAGSLLAINGTPATTVAGLLLTSIATVTTFVCFNAYVLDYIAKIELGRCETSRMFYSAAGWTLGPALGVILLRWWEPAPFLVAATASFVMMVMFLIMRMGNGTVDHQKPRCSHQPAGVFATICSAAAAGRGMAVRGHPVLRLVGLCGRTCRFMRSSPDWGISWAGLHCRYRTQPCSLHR